MKIDLTMRKMQSEHIRDRINQFDLYLEFGGNDDFPASRVLPGFAPDAKLRMLMPDQAEIVMASGY